MADTAHRNVLVIEDDPNTAALISLYFEKAGFAAEQASDGESGVAKAAAAAPDLVVLDLMLPKLDGWEVCRRLRAISDVPIIMLTARGEEEDRINGLTLGADDYVVKPFSPRELVARAEAVLRRTRRSRPVPVQVMGELLLDRSRHRLTVGGAPIALTPHEFTLLATLMEHPGHPQSRADLLARLYPEGEAVVVDRVIDVHIGKLRQKIEPDPAHPVYVITERGVGYRFAEAAPEDIKATP